MPAAFIAGCAGLTLSAAERDFFRDSQPAGFILFTRNCADRAQVRALTDAFRDAIGRDDALVLIDQEGGRVQRMQPPEWRSLPAAAVFAKLYAAAPARGLEAAKLISQLCAFDLISAGINMNCVPVLDVPAADGHEIIGTRAYGDDIATIVALARAVAEAHMACGVAPVVKHVPGHGRATADSHLLLPRVGADRDALEMVDFAPFKALGDMPAGMTAHVVYDALDAVECASTSATVIGDVIRNEIGFDGFLMSDDLSMKALDGDMASRTRRVLSAGCDVALHCNGDLAEMEAVASVAPGMTGDATRRFTRVFEAISGAEPVDPAALSDTLASRFHDVPELVETARFMGYNPA